MLLIRKHPHLSKMLFAEVLSIGTPAFVENANAAIAYIFSRKHLCLGILSIISKINKKICPHFFSLTFGYEKRDILNGAYNIKAYKEEYIDADFGTQPFVIQWSARKLFDKYGIFFDNGGITFRQRWVRFRQSRGVFRQRREERFPLFDNAGEIFVWPSDVSTNAGVLAHIFDKSASC